MVNINVFMDVLSTVNVFDHSNYPMGIIFVQETTCELLIAVQVDYVSIQDFETILDYEDHLVERISKEVVTRKDSKVLAVIILAKTVHLID